MLSEDAFAAWLAMVGAPSRSGELASLIGENVAKIRAQRLRSRVSWSVVVAVSRALGRNPVRDLQGFPVFAAVDVVQPTSREALSQVQVEDVLLEISKRRRSEIARMVGAAGYELQAFPFEESTRYWFDAMDANGTLRGRLVEATTLDKTSLSRAISANTLSPEQAVTAAVMAGGTPTVGLVIIGLVSAAEAGWAPTVRDTALIECSDTDLIDLADARLRTLRRKIRADLVEANYWKTLG
ncbi:hypothetical protein KZI27_01060 (plasmid) [Curtobacterium sp. TC1]|uniref:hypothetical protein n=1 Tax=Curtobacterium sp. TC1 TaxID=2862880 RepID=UPI001C9B1635|nr:hypothetical protein [Curtobacterium sp. TC1]QZQ53765.1 hypothetical protein KZI27_01060 [Curtobacterium sp. TC1]